MERRRLAVPAIAAAVCVIMALIMIFTVPKKAVPKVGICIASRKDISSNNYAQILKDNLSSKGCIVNIADAGADQSVQLMQIITLIDDGFDILVIDPVMVSAAEEITILLKEADIPAVFIGQQPQDDVSSQWERICYVGSDSSQLGYLQGQLILDVLNQGDVNEDGLVSYIMLQDDPQKTHTLQRSEGVLQALKDANIPVTALRTLCGNNDQAESRMLCAKSLAELGKDIEVIFCNTDTMALGAFEAIQDGGWMVGTDIYLVSIGGNQKVLEHIQQGRMTGTVMEDIPAQVQKTADVILRLFQGESVEQIYYVDYLKITQKNVMLHIE